MLRLTEIIQNVIHLDLHLTFRCRSRTAMSYPGEEKELGIGLIQS